MRSVQTSPGRRRKRRRNRKETCEDGESGFSAWSIESLGPESGVWVLRDLSFVNSACRNLSFGTGTWWTLVTLA